MKSHTIEIIDNHIKALEEELEWYQQKNREWQEKCTRLREQLRWHSVSDDPPVSDRYLVKCWVKSEDKVALIKDIAYYNAKEKYWTKAAIKWMYIPDDNQGTDCTQEGE